MTTIDRDPSGAEAAAYDLLVIGGGIHGAALTLEASRRGLSVLLVERGDFGGATSWNSLRIVHGGLRYLQSLDLPRFRESVAERRWWLRHFPDLVRPLPCLMPLYSPPRGGRMRRRSLFRLALLANELFSRRRNDGVREDRALPPGRLLSPEETAELFPGVDRDGLRGAALWHDAVVPEPQRLMIEVLRWACTAGARTLNYTEAVELRTREGKVAGIRAIDRISGRSLELKARTVVSCAGPWSRQLAGRFDRDLPELFRPVLAFNLLLDREAPARTALAAASREAGAQTWFLLPLGPRTLAGTFYVPAGERLESGPSENQVEAFLAALRQAVPDWAPRREEVRRVLWGYLPADGVGSVAPSSRPVVHDHGSAGGPAGLISVSGVKLTTARNLSEAVVAEVFAARGRRLPAPDGIGRPAADPPLPLGELLALASHDRAAALEHLRGIADRQAAVHPEDLLLRRADWGLHPEGTRAERLCRELWAQPELARRAAGEGRR